MVLNLMLKAPLDQSQNMMNLKRKVQTIFAIYHCIIHFKCDNYFGSIFCMIGFPLAYVGDVVGTGSSRKSATNR